MGLAAFNSLRILTLTLSAVAAGCLPPKADVPYVPTDDVAVRRMLELAQVGSGDVVFDLGSGDGRIPIAAVRDFGASRAVGVEIDAALVKTATENAAAANVGDRVNFIQGDIFEADFSSASVVMLYLWPEVNLRLRPILLKQLKPGSRVVSHSHNMGDWKPDKQIVVTMPDGAFHNIYLWVIPERPNE